ncbi:MAG: hypothetical protein H0W40_14975 [Methylibium sp.]|uniref:hypothetical protein n=1 Tax=Methylibium sp. TaxID=2067992 RepID=UPI001857286E|nr:hypothetical protein [Methylibium sp.]MBA3598660.1 hypothetical protein [Methylibium sp.]
MIIKATVQEPFPYAGPDGPQPTVPKGPCSVEPHAGTVTLTWSEGAGEETAVISSDQFDQLVQRGAIILLP